MFERGCGCNRCQNKSCTSRVPIFSGLNSEDLDKITDLIIHKEFAKGELIVREGEPFENLIIINEGQTKAYKYNNEGKEQILYLFATGDFLGEKNILKEQLAAYYVEALEKTKVCMIYKKDFRALLSQHSDISLKIIDELTDRINKLESTVQSMGTQNVEGRISSVLLEFAGKYGKFNGKDLEFELPLSREGIANYVGSTRETVSRKLTQLQEDGIIEMIGNKKIILRNQAALEQMS